MLHHCLLTCIVSDKKSAFILIFFPFCIVCLFFLWLLLCVWLWCVLVWFSSRFLYWGSSSSLDAWGVCSFHQLWNIFGHSFFTYIFCPTSLVWGLELHMCLGGWSCLTAYWCSLYFLNYFFLCVLNSFYCFIFKVINLWYLFFG